MVFMNRYNIAVFPLKSWQAGYGQPGCQGKRAQWRYVCGLIEMDMLG
jgi:hypothetical protein